jgi:hypothetical protein
MISVGRDDVARAGTVASLRVGDWGQEIPYFGARLAADRRSEEPDQAVGMVVECEPITRVLHVLADSVDLCDIRQAATANLLLTKRRCQCPTPL